MTNKKPEPGVRFCGNCHWYDGWFCDCMFGEHDKEMRGEDWPACDDWAPVGAIAGVLANGWAWEVWE